MLEKIRMEYHRIAASFFLAGAYECLHMEAEEGKKHAIELGKWYFDRAAENFGSYSDLGGKDEMMRLGFYEWMLDAMVLRGEISDRCYQCKKHRLLNAKTKMKHPELAGVYLRF